MRWLFLFWVLASFRIDAQNAQSLPDLSGFYWDPSQAGSATLLANFADGLWYAVIYTHHAGAPVWVIASGNDAFVLSDSADLAILQADTLISDSTGLASSPLGSLRLTVNRHGQIIQRLDGVVSTLRPFPDGVDVGNLYAYQLQQPDGSLQRGIVRSTHSRYGIYFTGQSGIGFECVACPDQGSHVGDALIERCDVHCSGSGCFLHVYSSAAAFSGQILDGFAWIRSRREAQTLGTSSGASAVASLRIHRLPDAWGEKWPSHAFGTGVIAYR